MSKNKKLISETIAASIATKQSLLESSRLVSQIETFADTLVQCFKNDGKVFFCGNGGSAADAQHISAELTGRFYLDRKPLY